MKRRVPHAALALLALITGCDSARAPSHSPASAAAPTTSAVSIPVAALSDPGPPSQVGPGPLSAATLKTLLQYFEDHVAAAYASGDADALYHYLAGPMLTGNRGTINLLNTRHQRNLYQITVGTVNVESSDANRAVFDMNGTMTLNTFTDATTGKALANGLSAPGPVSFVMFFDYNPAVHTWYWTGEQRPGQTPPTVAP